MTTDARGHTVPAGSDAFDPQASDVALSLSINDVIIAANATDAATKVAAVGPTSSRPCLVWQVDTKTLKVYDGTVSPQVNPGAWVDLTRTAFQTSVGTTWTSLTGTSGVVVPAGRQLEVEYKAPSVQIPSGGGCTVELIVGAQTVSARYSLGAGVGAHLPCFLTDAVSGTGASVSFLARAAAHTGTVQIGADIFDNAPVVFRYRII